MSSIRRTLGVWLFLAIALIGWLDVSTGPDFGLSLLYLTPIGIAGWFSGRRTAVALAVAAAGAWLYADLNTHNNIEATISLWNGSTRLFIYLSMALGVSLIRTDRERLTVLLERETVLAQTDTLTGLLNSRAFRERVGGAVERAVSASQIVCLVYFDIDNFKRINDGYGHAVGDSVLIDIAGVITGHLRTGDFAARLGGDEFAILLLDAEQDLGIAVAQRIISGVEKIGVRYPGSGLGASGGAADLCGGITDPGALLSAADQAMYQVKQANKGSVRRSVPPPQGPRTETG